ncbi:MAG: RluA family pseudouridine synthase [Prevotella sp.]|jgi:23S rRNA pseudouridine1911/1915/1917 synthase|nr:MULTISPECIES: RluA family pseudouridine synthase [unclassified Prevotella]MCH3992288.1 RluA family pseudouridine synthase [Prevotella sp.]MCH4251059.1 RluA family pseudouridine synthase [Prevotella sp.]MCI1371446.1 RluA family pseudouridine synthase [Prevotella sp.]MCI1473221.1 RluA family pseudouridine synthase [Prevotella sp.]MCI1518681.1 RluA family pseudouridine synthase [Prevotella sp.]
MNNRHFKDEDHYTVYQVSKPAPLLAWLLENIKGQSKTKIKETLKGQGITVDGKTITRFDYPLLPGMRVGVSRSKQVRTPQNPFIRVVYEDPYVIVIEKNTGILSMAAGHSSLNVKTVLDKYFHDNRQKCHAHVVHRLDRDTSGLMIYAKDVQIAMQLEKNWHQTVYDRRYVAVLSGVMEKDSGTLTSWLTEDAAYTTVSSSVDNGGKYAVTHYHVLDRSDRYSLVEFRLETGRKNQIRVHAADMGHPVCGDPKYGNGDDPCHRLCLHAYILCFYHPVTGERMEFKVPIPYSFRQLFRPGEPSYGRERG